MTSTVTRRSATALSAVALAALLGTPAYAAGNDGTPGNDTSAAAQAASHGNGNGNGASAQSSDHGQQAAAGNSADAPGQAGKPDAPDEDKGAKPEAAAKPQPVAKPQPAAKPAKATADNTDGGYRGKSPSTPDQDGVGMDRGLDNNDKTGPGTDGNNGCGNDEDREDDNNGWCGRKPKKVRSAPVRSAAPAVATRTLSAVSTTVVAPVVAPAPAPAPAAAPVARPATTTRTAVQGVRAVRGAARPIAPAAVAGTRIVAARPAPSVLQQATLPYTGSNAQTLMVLGVVLVAGGLVVREIARSAEATA